MKKSRIIINGIAIYFMFSVCYALDLNEESIDGNVSGNYDYLVYAITWQPSFCLINKCNTQPKNKFYVHGIWPYFKSFSDKTNRHPSFCTFSPGCDSSLQPCELTAATLQNAKKNKNLKKIIPDFSDVLMKHEWKKHGTCYGKKQTEYFEDFVKFKSSVKIDKKFFELVGNNASIMQDVKAKFPVNTFFR